MIYLEQTPSPVLRPWVRTLWYCRNPLPVTGRERVLPNGCTQVVLNLARNFLTECREDGTVSGRLSHAIVAGTRARFEVIDVSDTEHLAGVVIEPGGFTGLFDERCDLFFEQSVALDCLWPQRTIVERLLEAPTPAAKLATLDALLRQTIGSKLRRSSVAGLAGQAIRVFQTSEASVAECARITGVSERRLSQVFREEVGVPPRLWCRIRRFQGAIQDMYKGVDVPWAELALRCGYYDQSHFINDFRAFSGISPTTYSVLDKRWHNHVPLL
ncbi:MAG: AraC family transcriptional regulator [Bryobacteraceae bacterium]|nr:AraC family transcriptional regulator [Bryobacteraceae bacterium]